MTSLHTLRIYPSPLSPFFTIILNEIFFKKAQRKEGQAGIGRPDEGVRQQWKLHSRQEQRHCCSRNGRLLSEPRTTATTTKRRHSSGREGFCFVTQARHDRDRLDTELEERSDGSGGKSSHCYTPQGWGSTAGNYSGIPPDEKKACAIRRTYAPKFGLLDCLALAKVDAKILLSD